MRSMSAVADIEKAIEKLPSQERDALESRLLARRFGLAALEENERAELLASLDSAESEIDSGFGHTGDELRQALRSWVGK
jgi:hypothetical protein